MQYLEKVYGTRWHAQFQLVHTPSIHTEDDQTEQASPITPKSIDTDKLATIPCITPSKRIQSPSSSDDEPPVSYAQENEVPPRHVPPMIRIPLSNYRNYFAYHPDREPMTFNPSENYFTQQNQFVEIQSPQELARKRWKDALTEALENNTLPSREI